MWPQHWNWLKDIFPCSNIINNTETFRTLHYFWKCYAQTFDKNIQSMCSIWYLCFLNEHTCCSVVLSIAVWLFLPVRVDYKCTHAHTNYTGITISDGNDRSTCKRFLNALPTEPIKLVQAQYIIGGRNRIKCPTDWTSWSCVKCFFSNLKTKNEPLEWNREVEHNLKFFGNLIKKLFLVEHKNYDVSGKRNVCFFPSYFQD